MAEVAQQLRRSSRLRLALDAIRGREREADSPLDQSISFPELVWAHHLRQKEVYRRELNGTWENEYRRRLKIFKAKHGDIVEAYWCRFEASGVALTEQRLPRRLTNFFRRDSILRLHTATDWRTANAPIVAASLHRWETAAIKAREVLRESSERIALHWILAGSTRLLAFVDRRSRAETDADLDAVVREQQAELARVDNYYARAGENSARIVYFRGMVWGTLALVALVGGAFLLAWAVHWIDPSRRPTYTLFTTIGMGAVGAILSVMTRMAKTDGFSLDFEVGRKSVRFLGGLRPWIGGLFALALYLALKSNLVELLQGRKHGIYFYATVAFLAGFSERWAKVLIEGAFGRPEEKDAKRKPLSTQAARSSERDRW